MLVKKIFLCLILFTSKNIICQKDSDEGRPYEFGFTIDGQQHRHEKKDQNGIIQGEFGFITADGVYHVTVYATDENGDFKILSMRNIRISAPLDGSPALGPISPEASKYLKKPNLPNVTEPSHTKPLLHSTPQRFERIQEQPKSSYVKQTIITSTQKAPLVFTTHSTIRPACAGCGLVTTSKSRDTFSFEGIRNTESSQVLQNNYYVQNSSINLQADIELTPPVYKDNIVSSFGGRPAQYSTRAPNFESFNTPIDNKHVTVNNRGGSTIEQSSNYKSTGNQELNRYEAIPQNVPVFSSTSRNGNVNSGLRSSTGVIQTPGGIQESTVQSQKNLVDSYYPPQPISAQEATPRVNFGNIQGNQELKKNAAIAQNYPVVTSNNRNGNVNSGLRSSTGENQTHGGIQQSTGIETLANGTPGKNQKSYSVQPISVQEATPRGNFKNIQQDKFGRLISPPFGSSGPNPLLQPQEIAKLPPVIVSDNIIHVMGKRPIDIPIKDKYPGMVDGLPNGIEVKDVSDILYKFKYTVGFHGHYERGLKDGTKIGGYFVNGRDGISRIVTYVADENGYRPKFKFINLGLASADTPNEETEKTFGLKDFEFVWYPVD